MRKFFEFFYLLKGWSTVSYSQEGEDLILRRLLGEKKSGFYVDVGAHHPIRYSNTYGLYKSGWRGLNIDAMPGSMRLFNIIRKKDINLEVPVSSKKSLLTYYMFNEPALNTFSMDIAERRNGFNGYKLIGEQDILTSRLDELLLKHNIKEDQIDLLSIDVEGLDLDVLLSLNLELNRPKLILIEDLPDVKGNEASETEVYLGRYNYFKVASTKNTMFFKLNEA